MLKTRRMRAIFAMAVAATVSGGVAETNHAWVFDTSGRTAAVTAPVTLTPAISDGFETAFWDQVESDGINVSSYAPGFLVMIR